MINTKPVLGDMRLNVTDNLGKYEVFNGKTWLIMENYDTIESLRAEINRLKSLCFLTLTMSGQEQAVTKLKLMR